MDVLLGKCSWLPGLGPLALRRSLPAGLPILLFCGGALLHFIIPPYIKIKGFSMSLSFVTNAVYFLVRFDWGWGWPSQSKTLAERVKPLLGKRRRTGRNSVQRRSYGG